MPEEPFDSSILLRRRNYQRLELGRWIYLLLATKHLFGGRQSTDVFVVLAADDECV